MPIDLSKLRETASKLDKPTAPDEGAQQRRDLQQQRGALNAEAFPPGQEPAGDPVSDALQAGRAAGGRGSDAAMEGYLNVVIDAAQKGDPRVSSQGTVTGETREQWLDDARKRQIANRDNSGMTHR